MNTRNNFHLMLSLLILCLLLLRSFLSLAADTISANQSLSGDQTIVSKGGNFELGFFKPGKSSNYYIGIWYKKVSLGTVVWVANRETPVSDKYSSHLTIQNGNLVLLNNNNINDTTNFPVWSTNVSSTSNSTTSVIAILLNNGNLKLIDASSSSDLESDTIVPIWESFENPSHTWLPGGKLSYDKITKRSHLLISWKNPEDPAPGLFSVGLIPGTTEYILKWNRTRQYWRSGDWNGRIFSLIPEMIYNHRYNFTFIENENESYFTYTDYDPTFLSRLTIDGSGRVYEYTWFDNSKQWNMFWAQPRQQCDVYAYCGPFGICNEKSLPFCNCLKGYKPKSEEDWNKNDFSGGCVRETELECGKRGPRGKFWTLDTMRLPEHPESVAVGSAVECESACLENCSCTAYAYEENIGCSIWNNRELLNLRKLSPGDGNIGRTLYLKLAESEFSSEKKGRGILIGSVSAGSIVLDIFLVGLVWILISRRKRRMSLGTGKKGGAGGSLVAFTYKELQNATKNFSEKLGGGGFGSVFRGTLPDSSVVAVKKLEGISQGEKQFRAEVSTIGTIQHVNLIRLRGFCSEGGDKKLLVYDYMENGSMDAHLFQLHGQVLDWKTRYQIALGTARGLAYLHEKCRDCIIHCDIKPENILLDAEFCAKVADFGLAKLVGHDFSRVLTTVRGTRGYLAPEWISGVAVTAKADVYSYGMMIFEFISGKRNTKQYSIHGDEIVRNKFFPAWAAKVLKNVDGGVGDILGLLDPRLKRVADEEEVLILCRTACWCIQDDENNRPSMGQVVQVLERVQQVNLPPSLPRSLQQFGDSCREQEHIIFFTESSSSSDHTSSRSKNSMTSSSNS